MIGIYKITNTINNKVYIGQSKNISKRWSAHRVRYQTDDYPIYRAMRKYDIKNFTFEVIEECDIDSLNEREIYWISEYNSNNPQYGYNLTAGGQNGVSQKLAKEQVQEIIHLLLTSQLSQEEIGKKYSVSQRMISSINIGETWVQQGIVYPIRKNNPSTNTCIVCGKVIGKESTYCIQCLGKKHRVVKNRPDREELKQLIRTTPFTTIGKMYNVSDNAVRKWCKTENLPSKATIIKQYSDIEWELI